jgi:hypothetical protein
MTTVEEPFDADLGESTESTEPGEREYLWRQYNVWIDLYKFHMELVLKAIAFYFFVAGGIITYYYARDQTLVCYSLLLPMLMSIAMSIIFFYGSSLATKSRRDLFILTKALNFDVAPDVNIFRVVLWAAGAIFTLVSFALAFLVLGA